MQYFSEAVLHCSWLNRLFPAGHHIDLTVILKPSEQRKQAIRDRNCSFRTFAFRLSDDELGLFGSCSALHTLNGLADGQNTFFKVKNLILSSERLCMDIARIKSRSVFEKKDTAKIAVMYAVAYQYEHRENCDHHALTMSLRSLLSGIRKVGF